MSSGFYLVSGFMHLNMGCQVMFVLANRMKAQNVDMKTVGSKILADIIMAMFKRSLVENILKMQTPVTIPTLYQIFNKIVNCSLMRLDKNSMQKLFYLVLMTLKRQIFLLSSPLQLYTLTLTHLHDVCQLPQSPQSKQCLHQAISIFIKNSQKYTYLLYLDLKEEMLSMFQSYRSKIVLFCQSGAQEDNGCFIYQPRNSHHRRNIGMGVNHPGLEFGVQNQWIRRRNMQLGGYLSWKTNLGKDDYDNVRGSSKIIQMKPKSKKNLEEDQKSIGDLLGIKNLKLDNFEVQIDIFSEASNKQTESKNQVSQKQKIPVTQLKKDNEIQNKINQEFNDLEIGGKEGEEEIDLLELMDS